MRGQIAGMVARVLWLALNMSLFPTNRRARFTGILVLTASLLCAACSADDTTRKQDSRVFGSANGSNGGLGATSGMSFRW